MKAKIFSALIAVMCLLSSILTLSAASSTIAISSKEPKVNENITVSITINTGEKMLGLQFDVYYNPDVLEFIEGDSTDAGSGAGKIHVVGIPGGKTTETYSFKFKTINAGEGQIQLTNVEYGVNVGGTNIIKTFKGAYASAEVFDYSKSDNANLKSLSLSNGSLSPSFSASRTSYTATVANSVTQCRVYATASDSDAKVSVSGDSALKVGKNTRTVTVTAPSGAQKTYTITITRLAENEEPTDSSDTDTSGTESTEEPTGNPLETTVDGGTFTVATDISGVTLPEGFKVSSADYNGEQVATAEDSDRNFVIYYLCPTDSDELVPYVMNESGTAFERLKYADFAGKIYIFTDFPKDMSAPEGYYETTAQIGGFDMPAYAGTEDGYSDFYYLYGFFDGGFRVYRYDSAENMLQRYPEFKLTSSGAETELAPDAGIAERFGSLSSNAKVIVIGLVIAVIGAAALAVLLIVKLIRSRNTLPDDYELEDMFANSPDVTGTLNGGKDSDNTGDDIYSKK